MTTNYDYPECFVTFACEQYDVVEPPNNLEQFVAWAQAQLAQIPEEYRAAAKIFIGATMANEMPRATIEISYRRPASDETIAKRKAEVLESARRQLELARRNFEEQERLVLQLRIPQGEETLG